MLCLRTIDLCGRLFAFLVARSNMTEQEFLSHYQLSRNPFADEDAQTDAVFKNHCITASFHPAWSKVYGDPTEPATAIVLGAKGSGKTAMRLQLIEHLSRHNQDNPTKRVFFVEYDDFNRYLGPFEQTLSRRTKGKPEKVLESLRLWDHMDAILCESVTKLVDLALEVNPDKDPANPVNPKLFNGLDRAQQRDFLLLAACYDQSRQGTFLSRWDRLRRRLRFGNLSVWRSWTIGLFGTLIAIAISIALARNNILTAKTAIIIGLILSAASWVYYLARFAKHFWLARKVISVVRVGRREIRSLRRALMQVPPEELAAQPLPIAMRTDDRYAMLEKLQVLLRSLQFLGLIVLIDRVDEPEFVNGQPERMKSLFWPLLDNKLLKHPGLGLKMLLPSELQYFMDRESKEFDERARLDKQNVVRNFDWTGEALYELVSARMAACAINDAKPTLREMIDPAISDPRLISSMQSLRTPRSLFRFLFRLVVEHCKRSRADEPKMVIASDLYESTLAVYQSELSRANVS